MTANRGPGLLDDGQRVGLRTLDPALVVLQDLLDRVGLRRVVAVAVVGERDVGRVAITKIW